MAFKMKYMVQTRYIPTGTKRRSGTPMVGGKPSFGVLHDTGNKNSTASGNVNYFINSANQMSASAHTFIDDKIILECVPLTMGAPEKAWHVLYDKPLDNQMFGDDANDIAAGVELCYGDNINFEEAYKRYVWYNAYVSYKFGFHPTRFVGHHILDPGRKTDPVNSLSQYGKTYTGLLADIVKEYNECTATPVVTAPTPIVAGVSSHKIVSGDTLWKLSQVYGTTVSNLIALNPSINPNALQVGDVIAVGKAPAPTPAGISVGSVVTVKTSATHYQTGQPIADQVKGSKYKVIQVKAVSVGNSKKAYLLDGIVSWVYEQDIVESGVSNGYVAPTPPPPPAPKPTKEYAYFPPGHGTWSVYPLNKQPVKANAIGAINPTKFGGLEYEVLGHPYADVVTIQTGSFGKVNIYVGDSNSKVYKK